MKLKNDKIMKKILYLINDLMVKEINSLFLKKENFGQFLALIFRSEISYKKRKSFC